MKSNGCFRWKIILFLVFSALAPFSLSAFFKERDKSSWPKPSCQMYLPLDPLYEANCPDVVQYVCATNGITYTNECFFCIQQWELGDHIKFLKYGKCH